MAIRYPRGRGEILDWKADFRALDIGKGRCLQKGTELAVLSLGSISSQVSKSLEAIGGKFSIAHYDLRFLKPLDENLLKSVFEKFDLILTIEDGTVKGGFGDAVLELAQEEQYKGKIQKLGIHDRFIEHGDIDELYELAGISSEQIKDKILSMLS
jgi:1-deoxy-D-xylulose-5-phosphate synthase